MQILLTYKEAKAKANKNNPLKVYWSDAGNGFTSEVYYCPRRKRQIWTLVNNKTGHRIV